MGRIRARAAGGRARRPDRSPLRRWILILLLTACLPPDLADWELARLERMHVRHLAELDPLDPARVALGRELYVDQGFSLPEEGWVSVSCQSCHELCLDDSCVDPFDQGASGADPGGGSKSKGAADFTKRNAPTVLYGAYRKTWGWIGRYCDLEEQILFPFTSAGAYNLVDPDTRTETIARVVQEGHGRAYQAAFPGRATPAEVEEHAKQALADFLRSLGAPLARLDRFLDGEIALDDDELLGARLFVGKGHCVDCHSGPLLSDDGFHEVVPRNGNADPGRGERDEDGALVDVCGGEDREPFLFQTPTLRAVGRTGPYMHDGRYGDLWEVIEAYDAGGAIGGPGDLRPGRLGLTHDEKLALEAFLTVTLDPDGGER